MVKTIIGIRVDTCSYISLVNQIIGWLNQDLSRYICIANVHVLMEAHDSAAYRNSLNQADMVTPDGMPLVWMLRLKGAKDQQRVYGPNLMLYVLEMAGKEQIPVGLYGGDAPTLEKLVLNLNELYPALKIAYAYSPPFRALTERESANIKNEIIASGARILFVGLGCPKQEIWMAEQRGRLPIVMLGVGAAFDFHAGLKRQSPAWMQQLGLEWLFRLIQEPRRLWRRYLYNNPRFIFLAILDLLGLYR
jgi:N-acetylglucosaminyldiphosphoundecaprenol N-acetyl-beta-D-mannosaminyltransferase